MIRNTSYRYNFEIFQVPFKIRVVEETLLPLAFHDINIYEWVVDLIKLPIYI